MNGLSEEEVLHLRELGAKMFDHALTLVGTDDDMVSASDLAALSLAMGMTAQVFERMAQMVAAQGR